MKKNKLIEAVKNAQTEHTLDWAKRTEETCDQNFVEANGAITSYVARELGVEISEARKHLNKLAKEGLIHKSKNNAGMYCRWWPANYLAEVKNKAMLTQIESNE